MWIRPGAGALLSLLILAGGVSQSASAQETLIDNFEVGDFALVTDDPTPGSTIQSQVGLSAADVIGGERTLELEATANATVSADLASGSIRFFVPADVVDSSGVFELRYNAGGADLTADGSDRIIVEGFGILVYTATLEVSFNGGASTLAQPMSNSVSSYAFPFDDFSAPGAASSATEIEIRLTTSGPSTQQVRISEIRASGPLSAVGTAMVDGAKGVGEWDGAAQRDIFSGALAGSTLYVMNDSAQLYVAVEVEGDADLTGADRIELRFDNDLDLVLTQNDDDYLTNWPDGDGHFDQILGYGTADAVQHGGDAVDRNGAVNFFEIAKPLASGDGQDIDLGQGDRVGVCVRFFQNGVSDGSGVHPTSCHLTVNEQFRYDLIEVAAVPLPVPALPRWGLFSLGGTSLAAGIALLALRRRR